MKTFLRWLRVVGVFALGTVIMRGQPQPTASGGTTERREFKVLKTYVAKDGNHVSRAYVIEWKGKEVVAVDPLALTNAHTDDTITVMVNHNAYPKGREPYGLLSFTVMRPKNWKNAGSSPAELTRAEKEAIVAANPPQLANLKVLKVYSTEDDGCVFRAYVVEWAGQEVIVSDVLVQGRYEEGDLMTALVMKHPFPGGGESHGLLSLIAERRLSTSGLNRR